MLTVWQGVLVGSHDNVKLLFAMPAFLKLSVCLLASNAARAAALPVGVEACMKTRFPEM